MSTREIPRHGWQRFFDDFSRRHRGELVTVEVLEPDGGAGRAVARGLPFAGISADLKDGENAIAIMLADTPGGDHVLHVVPAPARVTLDEAAPGTTIELQIASASEPATRVRF
jgi:hypothetical protein